MKRRRPRTWLAGRRVLVLDGHSRAAVEVVQSLGRAGALLDVGAAAKDAVAQRSRYARRALVQPEGTEAFAAWIESHAAGEAAPNEPVYDLIVPSTEASLLAMRMLPPTHPARRIGVLPSDAALDVALDKEQTWAHARAVGVPVPAGRLLEDPAAVPEATGFPCVLKPVRSKVQIQGVLTTLAPEIVRDADARARCLAAWLPVTPVQEQVYVPGVGVGVEVLYERGHLRWHFTHERIHELPLTGGGSAYRKSVPTPDDLLEATRRLLDPLAWHGVAMAEFKRAPDGTFALMEINPRLWGSLALAIDAGVDFPLGLAAIAAGQPVPPQPEVTVPCYTRSLPGDVTWQKANLRADHADPLLMTRPRLRSVAELLRPLWGVERWDHADRRDPSIMRRQVVEVLGGNVRGLGKALQHRLWRLAMRRRHEQRYGPVPRWDRPVQRVLFLCYGNICRSPFAGYVAQHLLPELAISSSGFHTRTGRPSPANIRTAAAELGHDVDAHRSSQVSAQAMAEADLILVMDRRNWRAARMQFPNARDRIALLGLFAPEDTPGAAVEIEDPYGANGRETTRVLRQIETAVQGLAAKLRPRRG